MDVDDKPYVAVSPELAGIPRIVALEMPPDSSLPMFATVQMGVGRQSIIGFADAGTWSEARRD